MIDRKLLIEALEVAIEDASHFGEYGGDADKIGAYQLAIEELEAEDG